MTYSGMQSDILLFSFMGQESFVFFLAYYYNNIHIVIQLAPVLLLGLQTGFPHVILSSKILVVEVAGNQVLMSGKGALK